MSVMVQLQVVVGYFSVVFNARILFYFTSSTFVTVVASQLTSPIFFRSERLEFCTVASSTFNVNASVSAEK